MGCARVEVLMDLEQFMNMCQNPTHLPSLLILWMSMTPKILVELQGETYFKLQMVNYTG